MQRWQGRPSSHANRDLMQFAHAFLTPFGMLWMLLWSLQGEKEK
jgi:hypothetical protein